jgi:hypothetical protein
VKRPTTSSIRGRVVDLREFPHRLVAWCVEPEIARDHHHDSNLTVIMANDADAQTVAIPIAVGTFQLQLQVRRVTAASAGISCVAMWG